MQSRTQLADKAQEETLDPEDWTDAQTVAHRAVDDAIAYLRDIRDRPVWQDMPCEVRRTFETHLPRSPTPLSEVYREISETLMPYPMGNIHPRFWAWYMGSSNFTGALATFWRRSRVLMLAVGITPRQHGRAGCQLVQGDDWLSGFGEQHAGQRRVDGQHYRFDRRAQRQGGHRRT